MSTNEEHFCSHFALLDDVGGRKRSSSKQILANFDEEFFLRDVLEEGHFSNETARDVEGDVVSDRSRKFPKNFFLF